MSMEVAKEVELYETLFDKAVGGFVALWWTCVMNHVLLILYNVPPRNELYTSILGWLRLGA